VTKFEEQNDYLLAQHFGNLTSIGNQSNVDYSYCKSNELFPFPSGYHAPIIVALPSITVHYRLSPSLPITVKTDKNG
jgi:hypothetical protein